MNIKSNVLMFSSACFMLVLLSGCSHGFGDFSYSTNDGKKVYLPKDLDIVAVSHLAADALLAQAHGSISIDQPILITTFVNIDNLKDTSSFGRISGEQVGSRMTQKGYTVTELRFRQDDVLIKKEKGEFVLTRELAKLSREREAQAIVTGTYAVGNNTVYVTTKLISPTNNTVIASSDYSLPIGPNTRRLLGLELPRSQSAPSQQASKPIDDSDWILL